MHGDKLGSDRKAKYFDVTIRGNRFRVETKLSRFLFMAWQVLKTKKAGWIFSILGRFPVLKQAIKPSIGLIDKQS
jgi:hypothetical protein